MNLWRHRETRHMLILGVLMPDCVRRRRRRGNRLTGSVRGRNLQGVVRCVKQTKKKLINGSVLPFAQLSGRLDRRTQASPKAHLGYCRRQYQLFLKHPDQLRSFCRKN